MSLEAKGTGRPDYTQKVYRLGSISYLGTINYVDRLRTIGVIGTIHKIGTVYNVVRLGSIHNIEGGVLGSIHRVGTLHYAERLGTIGHLGTTASHIRARDLISEALVSGSRIGQGSIYLGGWSHIGSYYNKTYLFKLSRGGSVSVMGAILGTATDMGTYRGPTRIGKGTLTLENFTAGFRYSRPVIIGGGTTIVTLSKQV